MKYLIQILFLLLTLVTNLSATPVFTKFVIPSNEFSFSKIENVKEESVIKIGVHHFVRSGILENLLSQKSTSRVSCALVGALRRGEGEIVQGTGCLDRIKVSLRNYHKRKNKNILVISK
jgi:hypothetical protein